MKKILKVLLRIVAIIISVIIISSTLLLVSCDWSLPKNIKIGDHSYTLNKKTFYCSNGCYNIMECDSYYDLCTYQISGPFLTNVKKIKDIYAENNDSLVIVVPKGINLNDNWNYKEMTNEIPIQKIENNIVRDYYNNMKGYKINIIVEYK